LTALLTGAGLWLAVAGGAAAATTPVAPNPGGEPSLATPGGMLDTIYGLGNLTRMDDSIDQIWGTTGTAHVIALQRWSAYSQTFGYIPGPTGGAFVPLFSESGFGAASSTATFTLGPSGGTFRWADDPNGPAADPGVWSARADENPDNELDHMVTWLVTGNAGHPGNRLGAYVIGFEDLWGGGDQDYNDLVLEVWGVTDGPPSVPLPGTLLLLLSGVSAAIAIALRRHARDEARETTGTVVEARNATSRAG
jgi:hypothetical protein